MQGRIDPLPEDTAIQDVKTKTLKILTGHLSVNTKRTQHNYDRLVHVHDQLAITT